METLSFKVEPNFMWRSLLSTMSKNGLSIGTHNGIFHCDEVLACTMLRLMPKFKEANIVRSRDEKVLEKCDIVVDVGGVFDPTTNRYDHHQSSFDHSLSSLMSDKKYTTKLSSAGLVYAHFGHQILAEVLKQDVNSELVQLLFDKVYENFVEEVDAFDNGIDTHDGPARFKVTTTLGCRVGNLGPKWNDAHQDFDEGFYKALDLVKTEFLDKINYYAHVWFPARSLVKEAFEKRFEVHDSGRMIVLERGGCPYSDHLYTLEKELDTEPILFVLFTDTNGQWRVRAVSEQFERFKLRCPLLWKGLRDKELDEASGIDNCVFVHASGFIGGNLNKEGALKMAEKTMLASNE